VRGSLVDPPVPCVAIRVRVPAEIAAGRDLTYQLVAENISRAAAHHVTVRVPLPKHARFVRATPEPAETEPVLLWKLGSLAGLQKKEIRLVLGPTGEGDVSCCARVQFEHGECVTTRISRPGLQVRKTGPTEAVRYDALTFRIEVRNTGRATARNVLVEETLPDDLLFFNSKPSTPGDSNPLVWKLGDLAPGATRTVEYTAAPREVGTLIVKTLVRGDAGVRREAEHRVKVGQPALSVVKTGPKERLVGRIATYRLSVSNTGTLPATRVSVSDELPPEIAFAGASDGGKLERDTVRWNLGTLAPGASRTVQLMVRAKKPGTFRNVCTASADRDVTEQARLETLFKIPTGLNLEIDKGSDPVASGERVSLAVRVLNTGKANETNVAVVVTVPEGLTALEVQGAPKAEIKDGKVILPALTSLAPGREQTAVIRLRADRAGNFPIAAQATSDLVGPDAAVKVEESLKVTEARSRTSLRPGPRGLDRSRFSD
jgi:uncharacterized repeat protein (TIGR01451 family)